MFAYRLKNKVQHWVRLPWLRRCRKFLQRLPYTIELGWARALARMAPARFSISNERLYPPATICKSTPDWVARAGKDLSATIQPVDSASVVANPLPKTIHPTVRRQFLMDRSYDYPETFVATIPSGRVWGEGFVITPDGQLLDDVSVDFLTEDGRSSVLLNWKLREIKEYQGTVAVLATHGSNLYYHWLFQLLPRIELIRRAGIDLASIDYFVVGDLGRKFQRESMKILGIDPARIVETSRIPYLRAQQLIVPSNPLGGGCFPHWMCQFLRNSFLVQAEGHGRGSRGRRIYISRGLAGYRRVLNEGQVLEFLRGHGFEEVTFESMSVPEQAATMASCEVVVAPHGGGLSNLVFCSPGTKVIEIFSPELVAGFFWKLSNQLGLDYYYLLGKGDPATLDSDYEQSWEALTDIEIDLDMLKRTLELANIS